MLAQEAQVIAFADDTVALAVAVLLGAVLAVAVRRVGAAAGTR